MENGKSKGCGTVRFNSADDARRAVSILSCVIKIVLYSTTLFLLSRDRERSITTEANPHLPNYIIPDINRVGYASCVGMRVQLWMYVVVHRLE